MAKESKLEAKLEEKVEAKAGKKLVKVAAKQPPFVDLITDTRIGAEAVEIELHPWLQNQIDAGHLLVVE